MVIGRVIRRHREVPRHARRRRGLAAAAGRSIDTSNPQGGGRSETHRIAGISAEAVGTCKEGAHQRMEDRIGQRVRLDEKGAGVRESSVGPVRDGGGGEAEGFGLCSRPRGFGQGIRAGHAASSVGSRGAA